MAALSERGAGSDARRVEAMVARHGPMLMRVATQFSLCHDDALDAYQRALEIYLRRLKSIDRATEGAFLRVVVKHEAMAIRTARAGSVDVEEVDLDEREASLRAIEDTVAGGERVGRSVEALKALKPDQARALLLKADGLSYDEIGRRFGWSYTKVNLSIAEGRKRFLKVYRGIESGEACTAFAPVLDALADGTATSAQVFAIRPHLRHCASCRATVRTMRFSRARRIALLAPFAWLSRMLNRADVIQYASSGGGRLGPVAGVIGLCLSGVGAGAACVMTGALPAAPIIAHHAAAPTPTPGKHPPKKQKIRLQRASKPTAPTTPEPPPRIYAADRAKTPTPTPTPRPRAKTKPKATVAHRPMVVATKTPAPTEFDIEGTHAASAPAARKVTASAARTGAPSAPSPTTHSSGGGGGPKRSTGGEFNVEG